MCFIRICSTAAITYRTHPASERHKRIEHDDTTIVLVWVCVCIERILKKILQQMQFKSRQNMVKKNTNWGSNIGDCGSSKISSFWRKKKKKKKRNATNIGKGHVWPARHRSFCIYQLCPSDLHKAPNSKWPCLSDVARTTAWIYHLAEDCMDISLPTVCSLFYYLFHSVYRPINVPIEMHRHRNWKE